MMKQMAKASLMRQKRPQKNSQLSYRSSRISRQIFLHHSKQVVNEKQEDQRNWLTRAADRIAGVEYEGYQKHKKTSLLMRKSAAETVNSFRASTLSQNMRASRLDSSVMTASPLDISMNATNLLLQDSSEPNEDEHDMTMIVQQNVDYLTVKIMAKHNQLISRTWIIAAIITQIFILGLSLPIFCQATLYHFTDNSGELTPLFFWPKELLVSDGQYNDSF